jgi:hypothetical protein
LNNKRIIKIEDKRNILKKGKRREREEKRKWE